ncbi:MAG: DUF3105 domain-containing protein [Anaerolineae bacterium]|nr:DUF3105 domain-containing protein [Anaerolineae bacterium]
MASRNNAPAKDESTTKGNKRSKSTSKNASRMPAWLSTEVIIIGGVVLSTVVILVLILFSSARNNTAVNVDIEGVEAIPILSANHVTTLISYDRTPPAGGDHNPAWQTCGVYTQPLIDAHAVHSLEHGVVWITYQPDLPADQVQALADITRRSSHRLTSPYPGIDSPIILTAWGYQLRLDNASDERLMQFINKYEQGPTTPEPGATCSGGVTTTRS